jgi:hypothetical protein
LGYSGLPRFCITREFLAPCKILNILVVLLGCPSIAISVFTPLQISVVKNYLDINVVQPACGGQFNRRLQLNFMIDLKFGPLGSFTNLTSLHFHHSTSLSFCGCTKFARCDKHYAFQYAQWLNTSLAIFFHRRLVRHVPIL